MARSDVVKAIDEVWASTAQADANLDVLPGEPALVFEDGWEETYSQTSGSRPLRPQFNYFGRLSSAIAKEINENGCLLEWDSTISYTANARVLGSNGIEYKAVQASTNQDPVTDSTNANWTRMIPVAVAPVNATESVRGTVQYATGPQLTAGTHTDRVATVAGVTTMISGATAGRLLPAVDGTTGQFLGHDGTYRDLPTTTLPEASETVKGIVEIATEAEATAGNSNAVVPTVQRVTQQINAAIPVGRRLPATDGTAGQFLNHEGDYAALPAASATQSGMVELATAAEAQAGSATRVVTGETLPIRQVFAYDADDDIVALNQARVLHVKLQ